MEEAEAGGGPFETAELATFYIAKANSTSAAWKRQERNGKLFPSNFKFFCRKGLPFPPDPLCASCLRHLLRGLTPHKWKHNFLKRIPPQRASPAEVLRGSPRSCSFVHSNPILLLSSRFIVPRINGHGDVQQTNKAAAHPRSVKLGCKLDKGGGGGI